MPGDITFLITDIQVVVGYERCQGRLVDYFEGSYTVSPPSKGLFSDNLCTAVGPDPSIRKDSHSNHVVKIEVLN